ncbi:MAG: AAA family ATPase [Bacteroides graminisolvens]|nr:AAA family ATPase [Bacteroides graminisolvens]
MKIQNITINKYKAFTKEEKIPIGGSNVFIYGENGSGKSSFYYALKDFFQSSIENVQMANLRNFNLTDGGTDCSIRVEFEGGIVKTLNEETKDTNTTQITDANRLKSFLTYKHLLGVHNIKISDKINVFELVVNGVLKHFKSNTLTDNIELSKLWRDLLIEHDKKYGSGQEFYFARQKKASVESKAIKVNKALDHLFHSAGTDYLAPFVNRILEKLYPEMKIEFTRRNITINDWGRVEQFPAINLQVFEKGVCIDAHNPHFALNEARLSAIAISIFLGAIIKQSPFSPDLKPLFLDDILIGLDHENRLKLLNLLKETDVPEADKVFKDFQIFITTYDRHWYEVAKIHLSDWKFIEFYKSSVGPQIIHNNKTTLQKARAYFDAYDFPACANYLRKECERILRSKLVETYTVGEGVKGLIKPINLETLINRLKEYYTELGIEPPNDLIDSLQSYKSILFNPMSHSDIESPIYRNDLELAFRTIEKLERIVLPKRTVIIEKGKIFNLSLPAINYTAEVEIAKDIYLVEHDGTKTETTISLFFKTWTREGVEFANSARKPTAITGIERLEQIKTSPFTLEKSLRELNKIYSDREIDNISIQDLKVALTLAEGDVLNDLIEESKQ